MTTRACAFSPNAQKKKKPTKIKDSEHNVMVLTIRHILIFNVLNLRVSAQPKDVFNKNKNTQPGSD